MKKFRVNIFPNTQSPFDCSIATSSRSPWALNQLRDVTSRSEEKAKALELRWRKFFAEPSCWWDKRFNKRRKSCPDFVHCTTKEALFVDSWLNPLWVETQLVALEHQCSNLQVRAKYASSRQPSRSILDRTFEFGAPRTSFETEAPYSGFGSLRRLCEEGKLGDAISATKTMQQQGIDVSNNVLFYLLRECAQNVSMSAGNEVFTLIVRGGLESNTYLGSQLIEMYSRFRSLSEANEVFKRLHDPNIFSWSAIVLANVKLGRVEHAIALYEQMILSTLQADGHLFVAIIKACTDAVAIARGKAVHVRICSCGLHQDICLGNALVNMYAKCGYFQGACSVFESLPRRDLVAWTAIITGYTQQGRGPEALQLVFRMHNEGVEPDDATSACILKACACNGAEDCGDLTYAHILENALELGSFSGSAIIDLYCKHGRLDDAGKVFEGLSSRCTLVVWNTMIAGYAMHGHVNKVLGLLQQMQARGLEPDKVTYVNVLSAELMKASPNEVREISECIAENGFDSDAIVGSALLHMHSNQGFLEDACKLFHTVMEKDVISWSTMVACYARHGCNDQALNSLQKMQQDGLQPNAVTFLSGLKACAKVAARHQGQLVHHTAVENNFESDLFVGSVLIDMYNKCKSLQDSHVVFNHMPLRDSVTWNAIARGYGQSNCLSETLQLFYGMQLEGLKPNYGTFVSILTACSSAGFLESSGQALYLMQAQGKLLSLDFYNRMTDLFGRSGHLQNSDDLLHAIPYSENKVGWRSLLSHCRTHKNQELGKQWMKAVNLSDNIMLASNAENRGRYVGVCK